MMGGEGWVGGSLRGGEWGVECEGRVGCGV